MVAYLYRAGSGTAGDVTRQANKVIEQAYFNPAFVSSAFGLPVKMVNGNIESIQAGDTASDFFAVLTRLAPSIAGDTSESFGAGTPNPVSIQGILRSGYINVVVSDADPVRGQPVYMRIAAGVGVNIGDFEAVSIPAENVMLDNVVFAVDGRDADNITEIAVSIR